MEPSSLADMCRFCLNSRLKSPVLMLLKISESQKTKFQELTQAALVFNESLPSNICSDCGDKLESFHFYRCQLVRKQNELSMFLNTSCIENLNEISQKSQENSVTLKEILNSEDSPVEDEQTFEEECELAQDLETQSEAAKSPKIEEETQELFEPQEEFETLEEMYLDGEVYEQSSDEYEMKDENFESEFEIIEENVEYEELESSENNEETKIVAVEVVSKRRKLEPKPVKVARTEEIKFEATKPRLILTSSYLKDKESGKKSGETVDWKSFLGSREEDDKIIFFCKNSECGAEFATEDDLIQHVKNCENSNLSENKNVCQVCGRLFENRIQLRSHLRNHDMTLKYPCTVEGCPKAFRVKHHLTNHLRAHTQESPFACTFDGCLARFRQKHALTIHIRKHTGEFIKCELCDSPFVTQFQLNKHLEKCNGTFRPLVTRATPRIRSETTTFSFKCPIDQCDESFKAKITLSKHLFKAHQIEVTSTMCVSCCRNFETPQLLKTHLRDHLPFTCNLCGMSFKNEENHNIHIAKSHDKQEIRAHKCQFCSASFKRAEHLRTHIAYKHNSDRPFVCDICSFTTSTRADLSSHLKIHVKDYFKCQNCEFSAKTEAAIKSHMKLLHGIEESFY